MNKVELVGTIQDKTMSGKQSYVWNPAIEGKPALFVFNMEISNGRNVERVRCVARGINAELLNADLGRYAHIHGSVGTVKLGLNYQQQVFVSSIQGRAEQAESHPTA